MRWEPERQAAESLKTSSAAMRSRGGRGTWPRKRDEREDGDEGVWLYAVPETEAEARGIGVSMFDGGGRAVAEPPDAGNVKITEPSQGPYYYDESRDRYVFNLPSKPRHPWVVQGHEVRTLVAAYSKDGDDATLNQLARQLGWHRRTVQETLRALSKTHDSLPFTDEEIAGTDEDSLTESLIRLREEKVHVRAERADWARVKKLAERAQNWEKFIKDVFAQLDVPAPPPMPTWKKREAKSSERQITVVSHATDLHFGKEGWVNQVGEESTRETCRDGLMSTTMKLIERIKVWGRPDVVVLGAGGDWFHIDNHRGTTTKGTPQDHDGNFVRIFTEGCALARDHIEMWRQFAPKVIVRAVRGNHDYYATAMLVHWLQAVYEQCEDVDVGACEVDRDYLEIGNTILGLTHGDGVRDKDLVSLMAYEAKELWSRTKYRLWLTGHWHTQITYEHHGVMIEHLPSLAGSDRWHHEHGYVGNRKGLMAHLIDDEHGPFAKVLADHE